MKLSDYEYDLPEAAIAVRPPEVRGSSRLLVLDKNTGHVQDNNYSGLHAFLNKGDVVVINNTRVIKARLIAKNSSGVKREILLLEKHGLQTDTHQMKVMYRGKLRQGEKLYIGSEAISIEEILGDGLAVISCTEDLLKIADQAGSVPLPPYMHRESDQSDVERYQTVFAKDSGSVAAPTASLNMTDELLANLRQKGIKVVELTLHVGLGTFMPIRTDKVEEHQMHSEYFYIPSETADAIKSAKQNRHKVIAVGTTVTRALEFAADKIMAGNGGASGEAQIFIYPGYEFRIIDAMVTNFHAPHSTVLMMAAAFAGWDNLKSAYQHAIKNDYKFLSYGDSMLIQ